MTNIKKIALVLKKIAGDTTPSKGVGYVGEEKIPSTTTTTVSLLQENIDEFAALLQALPSKAPIKESITSLSEAATKVPQLLLEIAQQLKLVLQPGSDSKEVAKIKATSGLNDLSALLETYSKEFSELSDLANLLSSVSSKHTEKDKFKPIRHTLRRKEPLKSPKPNLDREESPDLNELNSTDK